MLKREKVKTEQLIQYKFLRPEKRKEFKESIHSEIPLDMKQHVDKLLNNPFLLQEEKNIFYKNILCEISNYLVDKLGFFLKSCDDDDKITITKEFALVLIDECTETNQKKGLSRSGLAKELKLYPSIFNDWLGDGTGKNRKKPEIAIYDIYYRILKAEPNEHISSAKKYIEMIFDKLNIEKIKIKKEENIKIQSYSFSPSLFFSFYKLVFSVFCCTVLIFSGILLFNVLFDFFTYVWKIILNIKYRIILSYLFLFAYWSIFALDCQIKLGFMGVSLGVLFFGFSILIQKILFNFYDFSKL